MSYRTCDHLLEDGIFCSSPALRNQRFCYFHFNVRTRRVQMASSRRRGETYRLHLPVLDNMHAVQAALQQGGDALADDRIDYKRATGLALPDPVPTTERLPMSPDAAKMPPQLLTAQEYTSNSFGQRNLRANSPYLHENDEFQEGGGGGVSVLQHTLPKKERDAVRRPSCGAWL